MRSSFFNLMRQLCITVGKTCDFSKIDPRIKHDRGYAGWDPSTTHVRVPNKHAEEIIAKLKLDNNILEIDGEKTAHADAFWEKRGNHPHLECTRRTDINHNGDGGARP